MYTLSKEELNNVVGGGCPLCLATAAGAALGASGMAIALTTKQLALLMAGSFIFSGSILYACFHSNENALNLF